MAYLIITKRVITKKFIFSSIRMQLARKNIRDLELSLGEMYTDLEIKFIKQELLYSQVSCLLNLVSYFLTEGLVYTNSQNLLR